MKKHLSLITGLLFTFTGLCFAQEALKSTEEEYYDFLSLNGLVERPTGRKIIWELLIGCGS